MKIIAPLLCKLLLLLFLLPINANASNSNGTSSIVLNYNQSPRTLQFYARDSQDSANVLFSGSVLTTGFDSMYVETYRNNLLWKRKAVKLNYFVGIASFSIGQKIKAELSEYKFKLYIKTGVTNTLLKTADSVVCGDAYIVCGQSNSHPTDPAATYQNEFCRSFGVQTANYNENPYNPADTAWGFSKADGSVYYWSGPYNVGIWALQLQKMIKETYGIPTCIINGGRASSTIEMNLRNNNNQTDLSSIYGKTLYRVQKAGLTNGIKGIFWYQGESNGNSTWQNYSVNFATLYNSWKSNYPSFKKIFLFQVRPCCSEQYASQLREIQRKLPETYPDIELIATAGASHYTGCHYIYPGYIEIADMVFKPVSKAFYAISDTTDMRPPNIRAAYFTKADKKEIAILFWNSRVSYWPADTLGQSMKNYFYLDGAIGNVAGGTISGDTLKLQLINSSSATRITYLPTVWNHDDSLIYEGPFLRNSKKIGALSFHDYPIAPTPPTTLNLTVALQGLYNTAANRLNMRDTLTVVLRSNVYPYSRKDSAKATIDSISLTGSFSFNALPTGTYYITVTGRNCLETWSKSGGVLFTSGTTVNYNFTTASSQAYGNNLCLKGTKYCIYNSDINNDGSLDVTDIIRTTNDSYYFMTGYVDTDVNGDRAVDLNDLVLAFNNSQGFITKVSP